MKSPASRVVDRSPLSDTLPVALADVTCRQKQQEQSSGNCVALQRLSPTDSARSVSSSTSTVCTLVPVAKNHIRQSTRSTNGQKIAVSVPVTTTIDHYQSVDTSLPSPPTLPKSNDLSKTMQDMLVPESENQNSTKEAQSELKDQVSPKEMDKSKSRQRFPATAISARNLPPPMIPAADSSPSECCSCRSIVTEPEHLMFNNHHDQQQQHMTTSQMCNTNNEEQPNEQNEADSNQFIFYLLLKKLFSIFRRRRKKGDRKKRRGKSETEGGNYSGKALRRSGSVYSRCSMSSRKPIKLSGHCRFDPNVTFARAPSNQRYNSNSNGQARLPLPVDDCEECRREAAQAQAQTRHNRPASRRGNARGHLRRQSSAVERFARQHRLIMSMLGRQRFGVSKMFEELNSRCKDYRPNYQFLNQLLYQGVIRNRMSGYRYNLIRPILTDVPEADEEIPCGPLQKQQQHSSSGPRAKSRQRQNRLHFQPPPPPPPPPPVPPPSVQNCCAEGSVYTRQPPPSRPRVTNGAAGGQPPVLRAHSKVSSLGYGRLNKQTANDRRASRRSSAGKSPNRQVVHVPKTTPTDCIDCIISQLKSRGPPSTCTCCECQNNSSCRDSFNEEPPYKSSEFYPLLRRQPSSANRRISGQQSGAGGRNMSTRRRKMMCKKFDSAMIVEESFQCHSQQVSVTRAEQHTYGSSSAALVKGNCSLYGPNNGNSGKGKGPGKSGRSSLPTSSSSECSSSGTSRTSKYLQQCTCCMDRGTLIGPPSRHQYTATSRGHRQQFASNSQFTVPKRLSSNHSNSHGPVMACFCPGCIATHNMTVAKL